MVGWLSSFGIQLGQLLQVDANGLAVKKHKVYVFQRGGRHGNKVTGDGLQDELGCCLLRETVSGRWRGEDSQRGKRMEGWK